MALWNHLRDRARLARELSPSDWLSLLEAWAALTVYLLALRRASYERLRQSGEVTSPAVCEPSARWVLARRLHHLVGLASRLHFFSMTCLVQSLSLRWMLKRRGISSDLRIGAARVSGEFHAHAWLEMDGDTIGESEDVEGIFQVLTRRTSPPSTS